MTTVDVLIAGAGPAGAACATLLARSGMRVVLADARGSRRRPAEVFAPATLRTLAAMDLPMPSAGVNARVCRGVLSVWGTATPQFYDYELCACGAALAVDRDRHDACLVEAARSAGVRVVHAAATDIIEENHEWRALAGEFDVRARVLVDATGRSSRTLCAQMPGREFRDRLVSFTFSGARTLTSDLLLLEATPHGWWYASAQVDGDSSLVFVSDVDLVPDAERDRQRHFAAAFESSALMRAHIVAPHGFTQYRGLDARTTTRPAVAGGAWLSIGDAAFSVDPLSGEGTRLALESAERAARAIADSSPPFDRYTAWCRETCDEQLTQRARAYASVMHPFAAEPFWRRRCKANPWPPVTGRG